MSNESRVGVGLHSKQCVGSEVGVRSRKGAETREEVMQFEQEGNEY